MNSKNKPFKQLILLRTDNALLVKYFISSMSVYYVYYVWCFDLAIDPKFIHEGYTVVTEINRAYFFCSLIYFLRVISDCLYMQITSDVYVR